jgi:hypothetical protein
LEVDKQERSSSREGKSRNRGRNWKNYRKSKPKNLNLPPITCYVCGKSIDSISQAIGGSGEEEVAHFDCILRSLTEQESLEAGQKISYIGNGNFAVVQYSKKNFSGGFSIVRRIPFEDQKVRNNVKRMVAERKRTARV